jgi:hypothetical protein
VQALLMSGTGGFAYDVGTDPPAAEVLLGILPGGDRESGVGII